MTGSMLIFCMCSGFVFLRLLCPAILNPKQFNLITGITCMSPAFVSIQLCCVWCRYIYLFRIFFFYFFYWNK